MKEKSRLLRARVRVDRMWDFASQNAPPRALVLDRSRSCVSTFTISSTFFFDIVCNCDRTFRPRRVIGQDEVLQLGPADVDHLVVQARRAPPDDGETAEPEATASFDSCQWLATRLHGLQSSRAKGKNSMVDRYLGALDRGCQCLGCPHQMRVRAPRRAHDPVE